MPEGPSILILKEAVQTFNKQKIIHAFGNAKIDMALLEGKTIVDFRVWGKQFFIVLKDCTVRIHLLMFGSYSINEQTKPDRSLRLALTFKNGSLYFYTCSIRLLDGDLDALYDWEADVLSDRWKPRKARSKLALMPDTFVCDALLDQQVFSGVGNIIKNEVLFRIRLHPESKVKNIPSRKLGELIKQARQYSFDFLEWKKAFVLKKHWLMHTKKICPRCKIPIQKKYCGKTKRRTFFCTHCQVLYRKAKG